MTDSIAAPIRRGSVVWRARSTWLVWSCCADDLVVLPIRRMPTPRRRADVLVEDPADQLLTRIAGPAAIRTARPCTMQRGQVEYAGEFGTTMCRVSAAIARLAAAGQHEQRWSDERTHRRRAFAEKCAL